MNVNTDAQTNVAIAAARKTLSVVREQGQQSLQLIQSTAKQNAPAASPHKGFHVVA